MPFIANFRPLTYGKTQKYRNSKLTQSAKDMPCVCHGIKGTTVWAHSNRSSHGKGAGTKAHDLFGAYLCHESHSDFDTLGEAKFMEKYHLTKDEFFMMMWERSMIVACEGGHL